MIRHGNQIRFTSHDIAQAAALGVDLRGVTTLSGYSNAVIEMIKALEQDRPDLLEKIAIALAKRKGLKLPPKLTSV